MTMMIQLEVKDLQIKERTSSDITQQSWLVCLYRATQRRFQKSILHCGKRQLT